MISWSQIGTNDCVAVLAIQISERRAHEFLARSFARSNRLSSLQPELEVSAQSMSEHWNSYPSNVFDGNAETTIHRRHRFAGLDKELTCSRACPPIKQLFDERGRFRSDGRVARTMLATYLTIYSLTATLDTSFWMFKIARAVSTLLISGRSLRVVFKRIRSSSSAVGYPILILNMNRSN